VVNSFFPPSLLGTPLRKYALFISHPWRYNSDYEGVKKLLNADSSFRWEDLSVPFDDPLELSLSFPRSYGTIVDQLREKIKQADCLLVIAGMYCTYRGWIQTEIEDAKRFGKPVVAIKLLAQERLPSVISEADDLVAWRTAAIISAIRRLVPALPSSPATLAGLGPYSSAVASPGVPASAFGLSELADIPPTTRYHSLKGLTAREPSNVCQDALGFTPSQPQDGLRSLSSLAGNCNVFDPPKK
jgi:hypothetical protein